MWHCHDKTKCVYITKLKAGTHMQEKLEVHANLSPFSIAATSSIQKELKNSFFPHIRSMETRSVCTHVRFSDILKWDFNHPADISWESNTASCKHSRRLLESMDDNFLVQILDRLTGGEALLDLVLISVKEMVKGVVIGSILGCSNHGLLSWLNSWSPGSWVC